MHNSYREELRRWFIQQEVDLFRYRFSELSSEQKLEFLHRNNLQYDAVSISLLLICCKEDEVLCWIFKKCWNRNLISALVTLLSLTLVNFLNLGLYLSGLLDLYVHLYSILQ